MIYVHVPFCRSFCTYCSFYSEIFNRSDCGLAERFSKALCSEIRARSGEITDDVNTLYIGGGTPSVLPLSVLSDVVGTLSVAGFGNFTEFTVEVNPDDIVSKGPGYVAGLVSLGVDRVSMGVQSFDDGVLKWMNRRHDAATAVKAYSMLRSGGIENVSIDLIFGIGNVVGSGKWEESIDRALDISGDGSLPRHVSAYQLSVEEGSVLADMSAAGKWKEASDDECREQYNMLCSRLSRAGYRHYEISNFALPGFEAKHNSAYWRHVPYTGFGPGAHSFVRNGGLYERKWNDSDLNGYIDAAVSGNWGMVSGHEVLTADQIRMERIMLALRTDRGIGRQCLESDASAEKVSRMLRSGLLVPCGEDCLRIPENQFFVSDAIISELV